MRSGEIDDYIDLAELFRGEGCAVGVLSGSSDLDLMAALAGDFRHQRSGLSTA
jgi:hypothetical protein